MNKPPTIIYKYWLLFSLLFLLNQSSLAQATFFNAEPQKLLPSHSQKLSNLGGTKTFSFMERPEINRFSYGFNLEAFNASWFLQYLIASDVSVGASYGLGYNMTNIILFAGDNFSSDFALFKKTAKEDRLRFRSLNEFGIYLEYKAKAFDLQSGLRYFRFSYIDRLRNDKSNGDFFGFYAQPLFGKGRFRYGFRVSYGYLKQSSRFRAEKELGVVLSPFIVSVSW